MQFFPATLNSRASVLDTGLFSDTAESSVDGGFSDVLASRISSQEPVSPASSGTENAGAAAQDVHSGQAAPAGEDFTDEDVASTPAEEAGAEDSSTCETDGTGAAPGESAATQEPADTPESRRTDSASREAGGQRAEEEAGQGLVGVNSQEEAEKSAHAGAAEDGDGSGAEQRAVSSETSLSAETETLSVLAGRLERVMDALRHALQGKDVRPERFVGTISGERVQTVREMAARLPQATGSEVRELISAVTREIEALRQELTRGVTASGLAGSTTSAKQGSRALSGADGGEQAVRELRSVLARLEEALPFKTGNTLAEGKTGKEPRERTAIASAENLETVGRVVEANTFRQNMVAASRVERVGDGDARAVSSRSRTARKNAVGTAASAMREGVVSGSNGETGVQGGPRVQEGSGTHDPTSGAREGASERTASASGKAGRSAGVVDDAKKGFFTEQVQGGSLDKAAAAEARAQATANLSDAALSAGENRGQAGADSANKARSAEVYRQVSNGAFKNLGQGNRQLVIRLDPPDLGRVSVILQVRGKDVQAVLRTTNQEASQALSEQLGQLRTQLEAQGLKVGKLEVQTQLADSQAESQWQGAEQHNRYQENRELAMTARRFRTLGRVDGDLARDVQSVPYKAKTSAGGLDVFA